MKLGLENTFAEQLEGLYAPVTPQGFPAPKLLLFNDLLAKSLGLPALSEEQATGFFSGNLVPDDARPLAQAYAGHQFGGFSPSLGDGRALLLGEVVDAQRRRFDLQLKGSGPTPFSRGGDGRAAVGPVLREYIVSEAMYRLGVPTTRVLAAVTTGETIQRDTPLPGAVLARIGASHLRVGTLQFLAARSDEENLRRLVDYTLARHYPERSGADSPGRALLEAVALSQGKLIANWMLLGFIHGVMNTDNMTLSGETIDYGPCAFMEAFDPETVFSSIDRSGRYAFGNQPPIGLWNLGRMAAALLPLLDDNKDKAIEIGRDALELYTQAFEAHWLSGMRKKLGLIAEETADEELIQDLLSWMHSSEQDFTLTFRRLASAVGGAPFAAEDESFQSWFVRLRARHGSEVPEVIAARMNAVNPLYIPRNHLVEAALAAATAGDLAPARKLLQVLDHPYTENPDYASFAEPAPADFGPYKTFCGT